MTSLSRFAAFLLLFAALGALAAPPPGYYLVWGDEFNGTSLDPTKWWVWNQPDRSGYSVPQAATVGGGYLTITTYTTNGANYSAIVSSDGFFRERFGYVEASVEFNGSAGMFSDFWLQSAINGDFIGYPAAEGAEIDICEHRETDANDVDNISGQVTIDLHWDGYGNYKKSTTAGLVGSGLGTGFHTYGLLWNSTNYNVSIDSTLTYTTNAGVSDRTEIILFSSEVDSNSFCGIVPPGGYGNFLVSTTTTVVDYVRFYAPTSTVYWVGASSANWTDGGNWISNMVPTTASDVVFSYLSVGNYSVDLNQNTTVNSLSLEETPSLTISGNPLTVNSGGIDMLSALNDSTIDAPLVLGAAQSWTIGSGLALSVNGAISGTGNLTIAGLGAVVLGGVNTCSGVMTISSNSTLFVNGAISNPVLVAGGTLSGSGIMGGPVTVGAGGTLTPNTTYGTLIISNTLTLKPGSVTAINVDKSTGASGQITGLSSITYGGTLAINNEAGTFAAGDSFPIFQAQSYSGSFNRISPAIPGPGLVWDIGSLSTEGIVRVITTNGAAMSAKLAGQQVSLSWPTSNLGWLLQAQTNAPGKGLSTNWVTVPGSDGTNSFAINPGAGSVFFRLVCPAYSDAVFGAGDLVVLQLGNGSLSIYGTPGVLNDYSPLGGPSLGQVALPTSGTDSLVFGPSSFDGILSLSADGRSVVMAGYNVAAASSTSTIDTSSTTGSAPVPRAVGSVRADGSFALDATTTNFTGTTMRCAAADGNGNFWAGGGINGVNYLGSNGPPANLENLSGTTRDMGFVNSNLYFLETFTGEQLMAFSGAPKTAATPTLVINTAGTGTGTPSPKGFAINPALTLAYFADDRSPANGGGIQRYNWNGSAWVYAYTIEYNLTGSQAVYQLAVDFNEPNPIVYALSEESTTNSLVKVTDTGANSAFSILATAPAGDAFHGVSFAPTGH